MEKHDATIAADAFLSVQTARAGLVKGESVAAGHADEITVSGWRWGMASNSDAAMRSNADGSAAARRSFRQLVVEKNFDRASTGLMAACATNDKVKQLVLTMRKAGDRQQDFLTITLTGATLQEIDHVSDATGNVRESLTFSFTHVDVEYRVQLPNGQVGAATTFNADV